MHFKIENTQIKYTNRKRKFKRMLSFLFVDKRAFCYEIVFQGIKPCFLHSRSECLACFEATDALRISVLFLFHFFAWNSWPFSCYYNVHRDIDKINHSKMKNILCEIMLLAAFFDLDFFSPIGQLRPLIPALRMDYYLQYLSRL